MDSRDFLDGLKDQDDKNTEFVASAEHFMRLKYQSGAQSSESLEKEASIGRGALIGAGVGALGSGLREMKIRSNEEGHMTPAKLKSTRRKRLKWMAGTTALSALGGAGAQHLGTKGLNLAKNQLKGGLSHARGEVEGTISHATNEARKTVTHARQEMQTAAEEARRTSSHVAGEARATIDKAKELNQGAAIRALVPESFHNAASKLKNVLKKHAYEIQPSSRSDIPKKDFAQPSKEEEGHKGKYPIPDRHHAAVALGFAKMHHDPKALAAVRAKIKQKYPDMLNKEAAGPVQKALTKLAFREILRNLNPAVLPLVGTGAVGLGIGTYLSSRPKKSLGGRSSAEADMEPVIDAIHNYEKTHPDQGLLREMGHRTAELGQGYATAFRKHPLKAALVGASTGGSAGYELARLLGGFNHA